MKTFLVEVRNVIRREYEVKARTASDALLPIEDLVRSHRVVGFPNADTSIVNVRLRPALPKSKRPEFLQKATKGTKRQSV